MKKLYKSYDSSYANSNATNAEGALHDLKSEITDMEAGGAKDNTRKRRKKSKSRDNNTSIDSHRSKSSGDINFVLERKNQNTSFGSGSIFGEPQDCNENRFGMFGLGLMMIVCCVSSQIMVDAQPPSASQSVSLHHSAGRKLLQVDDQNQTELVLDTNSTIS